MTFLSQFHFIRPAWLLLVPVVVAIWWFWRQTNDPLRGWRGVMEPELLDAMTVGRSGIPADFWRGVGFLVAWLVGVVAVAGPTWRPEPSPFADDPAPVMLVLKAGETMDLTDLSPSRMERARLKITDFCDQRKGLPTGLVAYAGSAHLVLPPTRDTAVVATMAGEISPAIMPKPGDDLLGALELAQRTFGESRGSIVVVADTIAEDSVVSLAEFHKRNPTSIFVLGVTRAGTPELNSLNRAAASLGGRVTLLSPDSADIDVLIKNTAKAPVAVASAEAGTRWEEAGWWLVPVLAVFALVAFRREQTGEHVDPSGETNPGVVE